MPYHFALSAHQFTYLARFCEELNPLALICFYYWLMLGVNAQVTNWSNANDEFSLVLDANPLTDFVEVPQHLAQDLRCAKEFITPKCRLEAGSKNLFIYAVMF
ncbi:hypothetical protein AB6A40_011544 [Gnathostoma spinigerum]|uniref:Uncharacterized protein n=1 Tax=Gnathostoma spinigerum TaxID=75299 RepID=A0ABD6EZC7_9BILA